MLLRYLLLTGLSLLPLGLRAWGVVGHRTVGRIAENHLSPQARRAVAALLGTETLPLVSTFADEVRPDPQYAYTAPWHYFNTTAGLSYAQYADTLGRLTRPTAYTALQQLMRQLKDPATTREGRVFALKFIVHLVGDVHQPMHTGRSEDRGGNQIKVKFQGKDQNLHGLWDSSLIDYQGQTYGELAQTLDHASPNQIRQWQRDPPATWLFESYQLAVPLYAEAAQNPAFDFRYYPAHAQMLSQRLLQAGIRLAGVLNELLA